jgi:hypothetical protein
MQKPPIQRMTRQTFVRTLAVKALASEGVTVIWRLHVAAAEAFGRGRRGSAAMLIEIADLAEREWRLTAEGGTSLWAETAGIHGGREP